MTSDSPCINKRFTRAWSQTTHLRLELKLVLALPTNMHMEPEVSISRSQQILTHTKCPTATEEPARAHAQAQVQWSRRARGINLLPLALRVWRAFTANHNYRRLAIAWSRIGSNTMLMASTATQLIAAVRFGTTEGRMSEVVLKSLLRVVNLKSGVHLVLKVRGQVFVDTHPVPTSRTTQKPPLVLVHTVPNHLGRGSRMSRSRKHLQLVLAPRRIKARIVSKKTRRVPPTQTQTATYHSIARI